MSECPCIDRDIVPGILNKPLNYRDGFGGNMDYVFYAHDDGFGEISRVQFCKHIGRKRDVFECLNENEWKYCYAYCDKSH